MKKLLLWVITLFLMSCFFRLDAKKPFTMNLSPNLTLYEAQKSVTAMRYGIDNEIPRKYMDNAKYLANEFFEPLREGLGGHPIYITSLYRSVRLNALIGGSPSSDHTRASAIDMDMDVNPYSPIDNNDIFHYVYNNMPYYKLIAEFPDDDGKISWVHVSFERNKNNRRHTYIAVRNRNRTGYILYENSKHLIK